MQVNSCWAKSQSIGTLILTDEKINYSKNFEVIMNDKNDEVTPQLEIEIVETETLYERNNTRLEHLRMILDVPRFNQINVTKETYQPN